MSKGRVLVAMSGGVDSSVAAAILKEQGYDVVGVTMQVWDYSKCDIEEGNGTCCSSLDVDDARSVADKLDIPFYVLNCEEKFKEKVIDPFVASYLEGKTPLPCVDCNTFLKFDHLIKKMKELDCDYLATGHYAKIVEEEGKHFIVTSTDDWKDQTYFLFTLNPEIVPKLLFPVGDMKKDQVRMYAEEKGLTVARKKDSTGICFVGNQGYSNFITSQVGLHAFKSGVLRRYPDGEILGEHQGIHNFTYGQRRGLGIDYHDTLYVLKIDASTHDVWVGEEKYLYKSTAELKDIHLLSDIREGEKLRVKIRYHHKGVSALVRIKADRKADLVFEEPQRAVTPGQAAVFYRDNALLGGGFIVN